MPFQLGVLEIKDKWVIRQFYNPLHTTKRRNPSAGRHFICTDVRRNARNSLTCSCVQLTDAFTFSRKHRKRSSVHLLSAGAFRFRFRSRIAVKEVQV